MQILKIIFLLLLLSSCRGGSQKQQPDLDMVDYYVYILEPIESMRDSSLWHQEAKNAYQAHLDYIKELYKTKKAVILSRAALPQYDKDFFSMCFLKTYEPAEAQALAYNDPSVLSGLMKVKVVPVFLVKK